MDFTQKIINWYCKNKRDLPWRNTKNPYNVWLLEIILQQTRVAQGLNYYLRFINKYPTVFYLAQAKEQEVLKLWQGLGYYSRARNLHFSAKYIVKECNGVFPSTYKNILKLKGVGDYTASAISSICFNEACAVVDGNVYRVLSRYFGVDIPINTTKGITYFKKLAQKVLDKQQPGTYNQAIMDFGAMQCKPKLPNCKDCMLNESCWAWANRMVLELPVKEKKGIVKKRYFNYLVFVTSKGKTILQKRTKGIWKNLYQFPLVETDKEIDSKTLIKHAKFISLVKNNSFKITSFYKKKIVHKLSHRHIYTKFWMIKVEDLEEKTIHFTEAEKYPVPVLIHNFMEDFKKQLL